MGWEVNATALPLYIREADAVAGWAPSFGLDRYGNCGLH